MNWVPSECDGYRRYPLLTSVCRSISTSNKGFRSNDNLADLLSLVRNGYFRSFEDVIVIDSKQNRELLDAFIYAGYINSRKLIPKNSLMMLVDPYGSLLPSSGIPPLKMF